MMQKKLGDFTAENLSKIIVNLRLCSEDNDCKMNLLGTAFYNFYWN
jgi:hypothetical protein